MANFKRYCCAGSVSGTLFLCTVVICASACFGSSIPVQIENATVFPILLPNYKRNNVLFLQLQNESGIDWDNDFRKCGQQEGCPVLDPSIKSEENTSSEGNASATHHQRHHPPSTIDFLKTPTLCRCDENCVRYGDCCKTVLQSLRKIPKDSKYRCVQLLDSEHSVRMISVCPPGARKDMNHKLCENSHCPSENSTVNHQSLCPLLDVPVLNNKTGELYRSIFCARCHSVPNLNIHSMKRELRCSNLGNKSEWEEFQKRAEYRPGKLRWEDPTNSSVNCRLYIKDLQPTRIQKLIPDVRFCSNMAREECALDLGTEENRITSNLCFSYTQFVRLPTVSAWFKNPHCVKCSYPDVDFKNDLKCVREAPGRSGADLPIHRTYPPDTSLVGINILFHFSLNMDDDFVGYTSKCDEDEILDFIRDKCVPAICPNGYLLNDGQCEKNLTVEVTNSSLSSRGGKGRNRTTPMLISPRGGGGMSNSINSYNDSESSNKSEPCFLIILHPGQYRQLANGSLTVNKSSGAGAVLLFQPGEYERYNDSSMSICAEDEVKKSSFGPALSYISSIILTLSVLCSMVHVGLYLMLPKMRNLPGNNLLCLTASLLVSQFIFLTLIRTSNRIVCVVAATTMHYLFLASFCWMNIMSFDIWRTFSNEFLVRRYSGDSFKTFIKYSLFAWTAPALIVTLAILTDFFLPEGILTDPSFGTFARKLRPLYGHNGLCWIGQRLSLFVFFAFPVGLIILCNLVLFTLTAFTIWLQNREGSRFINESGRGAVGGNGEAVGAHNGNGKAPLQGVNSGSTKTSDRVRFQLYAKLALIMGLTWILGFLSGFLEWEWLWYPFVIFNGLQGTFIFIAFDCKSKIWDMVRDKCKWKKTKSRRGDAGGEGSSELKRRGTGTTTFSSTLLRSSSARTSVTTDGGGGSAMIHTNGRKESSKSNAVGV